MDNIDAYTVSLADLGLKTDGLVAVWEVPEDFLENNDALFELLRMNYPWHTLQIARDLDRLQQMQTGTPGTEMDEARIELLRDAFGFIGVDLDQIPIPEGFAGV